MPPHALTSSTRGTIASAPASPALLIAGIDEAGYGPRLGPLCVGITVFLAERERTLPRADQPKPYTAPDLWSPLRTAVGRDASCARRARLAVADSKKLKGAGGRRAHPLLHLERGVLAFESVARGGAIVETEGALFRALGVRLEGAPAWYRGDAVLPRATPAEVLGVLRAQLEGVCASAGVRPRMVRCAVVDEHTFNERYDRLGDKASVSFAIVAGMLRRLWDTAAGEMIGRGGEVLACVDRQGGRAYYADLLAKALGGATVVPIEETDLVSAYTVADDVGERRMHVEFRVDAEQVHLPVALASMTAKYVRELLMARFNAYWSSRVPGLRSTAGYGTDARRWLHEARAALDWRQVEALVRRA